MMARAKLGAARTVRRRLEKGGNYYKLFLFSQLRDCWDVFPLTRAWFFG
jgi:hypothetical protein